jgi:Cu/Ag efflux protein CusF
VSLTRTCRWIALLVASLTLLTSAPVEGLQGPSGSTSSSDYQGTGVIVALHPAPSALHATRPVVVLRHDPIVGLMDEGMEMPFIVASTELFDGLHSGDRVEFGLKNTPDALLVVFMHRLPAARPR